MRRSFLLIGAALAVVVIGVGAVLVARHVSSARAAAATAAAKAAKLAASGAPPAAIRTVTQLTSGKPKAQRKALTPELRSLLHAGRLFPTGTTFTPAAHSWHRSGVYANISGTLRKPGHHAATVEVGLVLRNGRWLVTFEAQK